MTQLLLKWNSYPLELQPGELADMFIAIADRTSGEEKLLQWIKAHRTKDDEFRTRGSSRRIKSNRTM